jgi:hypothetical protein
MGEKLFPSFGGTPFYLEFSEDWIKKGDNLLPSRRERIKNWLVRALAFIGCYIDYQLEVLSDPVECDAAFSYEVKFVFRKIHIFGILIYKDTKQPKFIKRK